MTLSSPKSIIYLQNQFSQSDVEDVNHATANNGKACVCAYCIQPLDCSQHYKNLLVWEDWGLITEAKPVVSWEWEAWVSVKGLDGKLPLGNAYDGACRSNWNARRWGQG